MLHHCEVDPAPKELYMHFCHDCWPSSSPAVENPDQEVSESEDSDTSTDTTVVA